MINETLVKRLQRGETLSPEDVSRAEAEAKLADYQAEAKRRADAQAAQITTQRARENSIEKMLFLDRQSELYRRNFELIQHEKETMLKDFDARAQIELDNWDKATTAFLGTFGEIVPSVHGYVTGNEAQHRTQLINQLKNELKAKGAKCEASCFNVRGIGRSAIEVINLPPFEFDDEPPKRAA